MQKKNTTQDIFAEKKVYSNEFEICVSVQPFLRGHFMNEYFADL